MSRAAGFTLFELLVAIVIAGLLSTMTFTALGQLSRVTRGRLERAGAAANARAVLATFGAELETAGSDSLSGSDLAAMGPNSITIRGGRGLFVGCRFRTDTLVLDSRLQTWRGRLPVAGRDSALVYLAGDSLAPVDAWVRAPLTGGPFAGSCPSGAPGLVFATTIDSLVVARLVGPAPVRTFETVGLSGYGGGSNWQFGLEGISAGAAIQPIAGPVAGASGIELSAWDRTGGATGVLARVAGFDLTVRVLARREVAVGPGVAATATDSARLAIRMGNQR